MIRPRFQTSGHLEVGCACGHNMLLIGPLGTGKSMLAKRLQTILPTMSLEDSERGLHQSSYFNSYCP